jgi:hypothetical protein
MILVDLQSENFGASHSRQGLSSLGWEAMVKDYGVVMARPQG